MNVDKSKLPKAADLASGKEGQVVMALGENDKVEAYQVSGFL